MPLSNTILALTECSPLPGLEMFALTVCRSTLDLELTNILVDEAWNDATVGLSATPSLVAAILPWGVDCFSLL